MTPIAEPSGRTIGLGLVGVGKIARDQHVPAIMADPRFELVATASRNAALEGVAAYRTLDAMIAATPNLAAVALCTPPCGRHILARAALEAGLHVLLEKPPGATVCEVEALAETAARAGVTLFAAWHSRGARAVDAARVWLAGRSLRTVRIDWREDIRVWHPGQDWILEAGGFGVFDPGINALSIATAILPGALRVETATLDYPENRSAPIAASLSLFCGDSIPVAAAFDFLQAGPQSWHIVVETDGGTLALRDGGDRLFIDDIESAPGSGGEYPRLYSRFADLIADGASDVDLRPLQLVADAFLVGRAVRVAPFDF